MHRKTPIYLVIFPLFGISLTTNATELSSDDVEFFESNVRPLLVDNCYKCHSANSERIRGGFLIDSKPAILRGGDSGPAIVPGDPANSRIVSMIQRHPDYEAMPPKSKLEPDEIETLIAWIDRGAPDPRTEESSPKSSLSDFNLDERKSWWSLQPVKKLAVPNVANENWSENDYDRFVLSKLEEADLAPAKPAERHTLLRRISFDLTGLAPKVDELEAFLSDESPSAFAAAVDRLLESPHFGEKWARHWLDLVRYAETKAFEQDYTMAYAYRYRDYLIRAFNNDLPYDQFVKEALAGDLLPKPRFSPDDEINESIMGPGFLYLTDGQHGPPDLHEDEARIFSGMIDVTSKAFLGSTLKCARCHDHKFDAITTADYYSFYGMLRSSRLSYANTNAEKQEAKLKSDQSKILQARSQISKLVYKTSLQDIELIPDYLQAQRSLLENDLVKSIFESVSSEKPKDKKNKGLDLGALKNRLSGIYKLKAEQDGLNDEVLWSWLSLALSADRLEKWPELEPLFSQSAERIINSGKNKTSVELSQSFAQVARSLENWITQESAFESQPESPVEMIFNHSGTQAVRGLVGEYPVAGVLAPRISGAIRSPDFIIDGKPIELQAKGYSGTVRLVIRNYELTGRGPTTAKLYYAVDGDHWQDIRFETYLWEGETAYLEVMQNGKSTNAIHPTRDTLTPPDDNAYIAIRFDDGIGWGKYWETETSEEIRLKRDPAIAKKIKSVWQRASRSSLDRAEVDLLSALFATGILSSDTNRDPKLAKAMSKYQALVSSIPQPLFARSLTDGSSHQEPVYIRGSHKNLSTEFNPRRFLDGLGGTPITSEGSGRLEWAEHVASKDNPLTARVVVNRLWKQIFGNGIVETTNDFGQMGGLPSHPKLLDYLASDLMENGWSLKHVIRKIVLSQTYQMSSVPSPKASNLDPKNRLLQHMPIRRLEAEAIRDHILACSNRLDTTLFGPSVPAYVEDHPDSRAKPKTGPIDGNGRRSIYLEMRRNFLPSFLRAFDMPNATEAIGKRLVTNVPAQSLALMNDPFVHSQAKLWAENLVESDLPIDARIDHIHLTAFSRTAHDSERDWAKRVITELAAEHGCSEEDPQVWTDLCHLIYNRKEFIYVF